MYPEEKQELRQNLNNVGIPFTMTETDEKLETIAATVAARSMSFFHQKGGNQLI